MPLHKEEVEKIARLAHLKLGEDELEEMRKSMSSVLEYVERLSAAETEGIEPTAHVTGVETVLREDEVRGCDDETREAIRGGFPETEGGQLKTRPVFE